MRWPLPRTRQRNRDLDDEIAFHLAADAEELIDSGVPPEEAERISRRDFGNVPLLKESVRETWGWTWLRQVGQDVRYGWRTLRKNPSFTIVVVVSLALGIGANTAIFSLIDALMLRSLPVSHPEELVQIGLGGFFEWFFTNPLWEASRASQQVFSGMFAFAPVQFNLNQAGEARRVQGAWVSGEYFTTLGLRPALGRLLTPGDEPRGCSALAVLGYGFWQSEYGGRRDVLGRSIPLDGHPFEIAGVVQPGFSGLQAGERTSIMVPICAEPVIREGHSWLDDRDPSWLMAIGRPKPGLDPARVVAQLKIIAPEVLAAAIPGGMTPEDRRAYNRRTFDIAPAGTGLSAAGNGLSTLRTQYRKALLVLMGAVALVLLIACANVANLLLARAEMRQHEIAIRMAIGAGRGRLIRQFLTESLMLSLGGAALGILFAHLSDRMLVSFLTRSGTPVYLDLAIDFRVLIFTIGIAVGTGLLFGVAPALRAARAKPRGIVKGQSRFSPARALATFQVALSLILATGAGLMAGTLRNLSSLDLGFDQNHVLLMKADLGHARYSEERLFAKFEEMREQLATTPGVVSASFSDVTPMSGVAAWSTLKIEGSVSKPRGDSTAWNKSVSRQHFRSLGIPLLAGRDFDEHDARGAPQVAIVDEALAKKFFGNVNPVGHYFRTDNVGFGKPLEIVGLVGDAKYLDVREEMVPTFYTSIAQTPRFNLFNFSTNFEIRTAGLPEGAIPGIKAVLARVNPGATFEFRSLALQIAESLNGERLLAALSGFFGSLGLVIAAIGLYGVVSYGVARRRNEIGIRMALGASQGRILRMVLGEVSIMIGIGLAAGIAGAALTARLFASLLYGVGPNDPYTVATAAGVLALIAGIAGYLPARRAARVDPMAALRHD